MPRSSTTLRQRADAERVEWRQVFARRGLTDGATVRGAAAVSRATSANKLTRAGFETYTPQILYRRVSHGRRIETTPLLFPSYVFVRIVLHTPQGIRPV